MFVVRGNGSSRESGDSLCLVAPGLAGKRSEAGPPADAKDAWAAWRETYSQALQQCEIKPLATRFEGGIRQHSLGAIKLVEIVSVPQRIGHSRANAGRQMEPFCMVSLQLEGTAVVTQGGKEAFLEPGDLALRCSQEPSEVQFTSPFRQLVIKVPHTRERPRLAEANLSRGTRIDGQSAVGNLVSQFFGSLWAHVDAINPALIPALESNVHGMVELAVALASAQAKPCGSTVRRTHFRRIIEQIEANLWDPELSLARVARETGFSLRYLHKVFLASGQTISQFIRERRLTRCYEDLLDPSSQHLLIGQISARWGFVDAGHFSRVFKQRYGQSPRQLRNGINGRQA
jgi:AraC-like DNA-binding protein